MFDIAIIGAGIIGCACAYELSKYNVKVALIEKENDICCGTTKANSAIIHAGYDPEPDTNIARLNVRGAQLAKEICQKLDVAYEQIGSLVVAFSQEEAQLVETLYHRGIQNGVPDLQILNQQQLRVKEPMIADNALCALYAPTAAICSPWGYGIAMAQVAVQNGTELMLDSPVSAIDKTDGGYLITAGGNKVEAKYVINAAGVHSDDVHNMVAPPSFKIIPSAGEYYLLDKGEGKRANHVIFQCPNKDGKGVLVSPTVGGNLIVGPNALPSDKTDTTTTTASLDFVRNASVKSIPSINFRENIRNFTGVRALSDRKGFVIEFGASQFIDLGGIKSPGLSAAPAIAEEVVKMLGDDGLALDKKDNYIDERKVIRFKSLSPEEKNKVIAQNPAYGRVICRCETITEGEILACLDAPIPPVSLDGVKRRVSTGMGRCQGGFCGPKVLEIIAKHKNIAFVDVGLDRKGSYILTEETKGGKTDV